jgi:hypothetical protein
MAERTAADDIVIGTVELEQKQLAWRERAKGLAATWLPEIHLIRPRG